MEPGRTGPEGEEGKAGGPRKQKAAAAAVVQCTPEGARGAGQGSRVVTAEAVPEQASQPVMSGEGRTVSSSFTSLKQGGGLYIG